MIYYLNLGFILEQALADLIKRYIDSQQFDDVYGNFHISVVNDHPFAHMIIDKNARCADTFPAIVVTSQSDSKPSELINMPVQTSAVGYTSDDIDAFIQAAYRNKKKQDADGNFVDVIKHGVIQKEKVPGFVFVYDEETINKLKELADSRTSEGVAGMVYGIRLNSRRSDRVSIEIWAENNQLKNELYEHLRLFLTGAIQSLLKSIYGIFNCTLADKTINGERSSNYNFDFDVLLCGSHLTFEVDYDVSQIILDTDVSSLSYEIVTEVINHVKNN